MTKRPMEQVAEDLAALMTFIDQSPYGRGDVHPDNCDFVFGNPHEMPLPGIVDAIGRHLEPKDKDWFAYKDNTDPAVEAVAASLRDSHGLAFESEDVFLTPGAFGALSSTLRMLCGPGDEVVFFSPPWFFYEPMIRLTGAVPVRAHLREPDFAPDPEELGSLLTPRTRAVLINTPHNPTGRLYTREELERVAAVLDRPGAPIVLLSDESYRRILFDGRTFLSPASVYPHTVVIYTYGKTLLAPGERLGYAAFAPGFAGREDLRGLMFLSQVAGGWQFPNATLQRALPDLEGLSIDVGALEKRRDRMVTELRDMGYKLIVPESTFYLMVRSPIADDEAFARLLAEGKVYVGPGVIFEMPGWFRISLTANDDMVERALPVFRDAIARAR